MTLQTTTNVTVALGNGVATEFDFGFKVLDEDHLIVQRRVRATGVIDKTYTPSEYTVAGIGDDAGSVTLLDGALAATYDLVISRIVPYEQGLDIVNQGGFYPDTVENELDLLAMQIQQVAEAVGRSVKVEIGHSLTVLSEDRIGKYLAFDALGNPVASSGTGSDSALRTDLAAITGALLIGLPTRSLKSYIDDFPHFFDFAPASVHAGVLAATNTDPLDAYLQDMLDTGKIGRLPHAGRIWIENSLLIPSYGGLSGNFGCEVKAKADFGNFALFRNFTDNPQTMGARDVEITLDGILIDGNKANNTTATEFSHCIHLFAVDGAFLNVRCNNPKGDGALISYSRDVEGVGAIHTEIGCKGVKGFIRTENAARMGVAITCAEYCDLSILALTADLFGFDIEPDTSNSYVRNNFFRVATFGCGPAAGFTGGLSTTGTAADGISKADVSNNEIHFAVEDCVGDCGLSIRDVINCRYFGYVRDQVGHGIYLLENAVAASTVRLDAAVNIASGSGLLSRGVGNNIRGSIDILSAAGHGVYLVSAEACDLEAKIHGVTEAGLLLDNTDNSTIRARITNSGSHGVWFLNASTGNRLPQLVSTGSVAGWGILEGAGGNDNIATMAKLSGNSLGTASLVGATSRVEFERLHGKATYDAPSVAAGGTTTTTVTVTGAAIGFNETDASFGVTLAGMNATSYVSGADTLTVVLHNPTAGAIDLASTTLYGSVTPRLAA